MILIAAFFFGFAEATLFFIVPDVLLTYLVLFNFGLALRSSLFTLMGALFGGSLMFLWGRRNFESAARTIESLPGISKTLVEREKKNLKHNGLGAILLGPLKGVPYKIYAICAPSSKIPFSQFLFISVPARFSRFVLATLITELIFHYCLPALELSTQVSLLTGFWLIFYTWYFLKMRNLSR